MESSVELYRNIDKTVDHKKGSLVRADGSHAFDKPRYFALFVRSTPHMN